MRWFGWIGVWVIVWFFLATIEEIRIQVPVLWATVLTGSFALVYYAAET